MFLNSKHNNSNNLYEYQCTRTINELNSKSSSDTAVKNRQSELVGHKITFVNNIMITELLLLL